MDLNDWLLDTESSFLHDNEQQPSNTGHEANLTTTPTTAPTLDINALLGELATANDWQVGSNLPLSSLPSSSASTSGQSNTTGSSPSSRDRGVSPSTPGKDDDDDETQNNSNSSSSKQQQLAKMTGRLDFRSSIVSGAATEVPEAQWRNMSSKDRRKLRNKISARNSRQKAKGYITSLEQEVEQLKADKGEMAVELKRVQELVTQLLQENEQLKQLHQQIMASSTSPPTDLFAPNAFDELSMPLMTTWLSHTSMPRWDLPRLMSLSKDTDPNAQQYAAWLFQRYPLLAPALMSMVIDQTMTPAELLISTLDNVIQQKEADLDHKSAPTKTIKDEKKDEEDEEEEKVKSKKTKKRCEYRCRKREKERNSIEDGDGCDDGSRRRKNIFCTVFELYQNTFQYMMNNTRQRLSFMCDAKHRLIEMSTATAKEVLSRQTDTLPPASSSSATSPTTTTTTTQV